MRLNRNFKFNLNLIISICVICNSVNATLSPSNKNNKRNKQTKELKAKIGPVLESVWDKNLIDDEPVARDILMESNAYYKDTKRRMFNGTVLGYVTPWNNHGYDVAKIWPNKFDIISPVWLQIERSSSGSYQMKGLHDVDEGWLHKIRAASNYENKVIPRVVFDKFTDKDFSMLLTHEQEKQNVIHLLIETCRSNSFDGIVLEIWSQLAARVDDKHLIHFVKDIAQTLRNNRMDTILVIPPVREEMYDLFSRKHFEELYPYISAFSLMTYDYSSIQRPGANAPLNWMRNAVEHICPDTAVDFQAKRKIILLGFNLYGNDYTPDGGSAIIGHEFLGLVKHVKGRLQLDETNMENFFEVKTPSGRHVVFYPTLFSINQRVNLANELGTGISIWELGQGLDYFFDLF